MFIGLGKEKNVSFFTIKYAQNFILYEISEFLNSQNLLRNFNEYKRNIDVGEDVGEVVIYFYKISGNIKEI